MTAKDWADSQILTAVIPPLTRTNSFDPQLIETRHYPLSELYPRNVSQETSWLLHHFMVSLCGRKMGQSLHKPSLICNTSTVSFGQPNAAD